MIGVREIRVGNYVTVDNPEYHPQLKGVVLSVAGVRNASSEHWPQSNGDVKLLDAKYKTEYNQLNQFVFPIPISEDILLRCGFEYHKSLDKHFIIESLGIAVSTADSKFRIIIGNIICQLVICEAQFLHHLQNIIFDLKGQELELKPTIKK